MTKKHSVISENSAFARVAAGQSWTPWNVGNA
jgi:hypothetical protein